MKFIMALAAVCACFWTPITGAAPASLDTGQRAALAAWLGRNPQFRIATAEDCDCDEDIKQVRSTGGPFGDVMENYDPALLIGDFRGNGQADFAVVMAKIAPGKPAEGLLLIFDGPFRDGAKQPAFAGNVGVLKHAALFLNEEGYPMFGPFKGEGCIFRPAQRTYRPDCARFSLDKD
jgi:hypothetical protein